MNATMEVLSGPGTVVRRGGMGGWIGDDVPPDLANRILGLFHHPDAKEPADLLAEVRSLVSTEPPSSVGSVAFVVLSDAQGVGFLHGGAIVQNGRGEAHSGALTSQIVSFSLPMDGLIGIWGSAWSGGAAQPDRTPLDEGVGRGGGLVVRGHPEVADAGIPSNGSSAPSVEEEPPAIHEPVQGVVCVHGHFNHPDMLFCRVCGIGMVQQTKVLVDGERPALGVMVMADGSTFTLDDRYLIGREPAADGARSIVLKDDRVSRRHALLSMDGWNVVVTDLGSTNGTYVKNPGWMEWVRVTPNQPVVVQPAGQIGAGSQVLVYESSVCPTPA